MKHLTIEGIQTALEAKFPGKTIYHTEDIILIPFQPQSTNYRRLLNTPTYSIRIFHLGGDDPTIYGIDTVIDSMGYDDPFVSDGRSEKVTAAVVECLASAYSQTHSEELVLLGCKGGDFVVDRAEQVYTYNETTRSLVKLPNAVALNLTVVVDGDGVIDIIGNVVEFILNFKQVDVMSVEEAGVDVKMVGSLATIDGEHAEIVTKIKMDD